jgi:ribosomal protein L9
MATASAKKILAENLKQKAHKEAKIVNDAKALAETLKALEIKITAKAGGEKLLVQSPTSTSLRLWRKQVNLSTENSSLQES